MAAALLGHIESFDASLEDWTQYVERLEQFFQANEIIGDANKVKRRATFLSIVGRSSYNLLKSLLAPEKPTDKTFEELVGVLTKHYSPKPTEVMQRFRFNTRSRKEGESISTYVAELRSLAQNCNYGDALDKMLRDRLVWEVKDMATQKKLLAESELTLVKAIQIAQSLEIAESNLKEMGSELVIKKEPQGIHRVGDRLGSCYRCGNGGHQSSTCPYRDRICHRCKKVGHLAKVCKSPPTHKGPEPEKPTQKPRRKKVVRKGIRQVKEDDNPTEDDEPDDEFLLSMEEVGEINGISRPPIKVPVSVDGKDIVMELDTGASVSVISEVLCKQLWPGRSLNKSPIKLQTYAKQSLSVLGSIEVTVCYEQQKVILPLIVIKGEGSALFGRNWLSMIKLNWPSIYSIDTQSLNEILDKYSVVFEKELGTFNGPDVSISVDPNATPQFCKARVLPYAMREPVEKELDRLVTEGTLEPVEYSDWAAPIVAVWKRDQHSVRICGDFRTTVNPVSKLNRYPLPKVEDLFATLSQGKIFTKLDLTQAYQQLKLNSQAQRYVVINTHKGLYRYTRLPFGISSAPGIFQKTMETLLKGIPGLVVYIDDILITSASEKEHLRVLEEVLSRLATAGLRAKKQKCNFMVSQVEFLGHLISEKGISPLPEKIRAIKEAPQPTTVTELKAYLGLLTYYSKFLPQLATHLAPLYMLLNKNADWKWSIDQEQAFLKSKELLTSDSLLIHYNPSLPLLLACDASSYGVGAVLAHILPDGSERPIAYASRTLNSAERNYSQIEKEGLSCVFGVKKFYPYLLGHTFTLITDHKPLLGLLSSQRHTSPQASARIRRWSLFLSMYDYELKFRKTEAHSNADALSRLPLTDTIPVTEPPELILLNTHLENSIVTADQIKVATSNDSELSLVLQYVQQGWPNQVPSDHLRPYFNRKEELSSMDGCILWGVRVIIPKQYQSLILQQLHEGHPGKSRMKSLARMYVWWPRITQDIEEAVKSCQPCQHLQSNPPPAPLHSWSWPTRPWARLHIDYAGPFENHMILIVIDAHSKWIEAIPTSGSTSKVVIEELRCLFSQFGIPESIVSDNGTCFTSVEFESFLTSNGIKHHLSAPYHPATNGLAERAVQIVKQGLKKVTVGSFRSRIATVLFAYRLTPQTITKISPSELLIGRRPRSRLDLLRPNIPDRVEAKLLRQKEQSDSTSKERYFNIGDPVYVKTSTKDSNWCPGIVKDKKGTVSYTVQLLNGRERRYHLDQIRKRTVEESSDIIIPEIDIDLPSIPPNNNNNNNGNTNNSENSSELNSPSLNTNTPIVPPPTRVYPRRNRRPVNRYDPSWN